MNQQNLMSDVLFGIIRERRSIRRYQKKTVDEDALLRLLEAARWAPSAHNRQPWRIAVVQSTSTRGKLAQAMGQQLASDLDAAHVPPAVIRQDVERSRSRIVGAAVALVLCLSMVDMDTYEDERRQRAERDMAIQSVALAGQNILLMAHASGLGACWMCAPLFCPDVVRDVLSLDQDWEPQALITIGYPAEDREKDRVPLETRVVWR